MSKARFVHSAPINVVRMAIAAGLVVASLFMVGLLGGGPATALADGPTASNCSAQGGSSAKCTGLLNGVSSSVTIGDIGVLNDADIALLNVEENTLWVNALNPDVDVELEKIASGNVLIVKNVLNKNCTTVAVQIGLAKKVINC
jgi:hypothetical protein